MSTAVLEAETVTVSEARGLNLSNEEKHSLPWAVPDIEVRSWTCWFISVALTKTRCSWRRMKARGIS